MPPVPTELLGEQIPDTNQRLAESNDRLTRAITESNDRLASNINELNRKFDQFRVDVAQQLGSIRSDMTQQLGTINASLEGSKGRTEMSMSVLKWAAATGVAVGMPMIIGLLTWSYSPHERAVRIEESIILLRDITKSQGEQIERLINKGQSKTTAYPVPDRHTTSVATTQKPQRPPSWTENPWLEPQNPLSATALVRSTQSAQL